MEGHPPSNPVFLFCPPPPFLQTLQPSNNWYHISLCSSLQITPPLVWSKDNLACTSVAPRVYPTDWLTAYMQLQANINNNNNNTVQTHPPSSPFNLIIKP